MRRWIFVMSALFAIACGPSAPPPDEVTESWTSGDDAPLEAASPEASEDEGSP